MKLNVFVGKPFTSLDHSDINGFFQRFNILSIEQFRWYRSFPPALRRFTVLYIVQLQWYRISPLKIIPKSLWWGSNLRTLDLNAGALPMIHFYFLWWKRKYIYFKGNKIPHRKWDKHNTHANNNMTIVCTCIQGINRYYSQVELSVTRKGERDKGVKLKGSINIIFCFLFLAS
jgi:hypothetical protein